jgi:hypothetical protein
MGEAKASTLVSEMLRAIDRQDPPLWPLPLIDDLDSRRRGDAITWAIAVVESQLSRFGSPESLSTRQEWIAGLRLSTTADPASEDLDRISREIWYDKGTRDEAQTAIARLYDALACYSRGDDAGYRKSLAMAVMVIASDERGSPSPLTITKMIDLFNNSTAEGGC